MKKSTRRAFLTAGLGLTQLALLERMGLSLFSSRTARAAPSGGPTRFLTIYVPGGWMPVYMWCPLAATDIATLLPPAQSTGAGGEDRIFFDPHEVENLDGSGNQDADAPIQRLRVARTWNDAELQKRAAGQAGNPRAPKVSGGPSSMTNGFSWLAHSLHQNVSVVHGVDQGTAAHDSGRISAMCGAPGSNYRAPGMPSLVANQLSLRFPDRPLPCVVVGNAPVPDSLALPSLAAPTVLASMGGLDYSLSRNNDSAWKGLREVTPTPQLDFHGQPLGFSVPTNPMDEYAMRHARALAGQTNAATDAFLERLHDRYRNVSELLSRDVQSVLAKTPGIEHGGNPYWTGNDAWSTFGISGNGRAADGGNTWDSSFELALKLLKSDLTSAVVLNCQGIGGAFLDTHANEERQFDLTRGVMEVIGRLLGEMKATPAPGGGKSLLDDTLVVMVSEFARTWPTSNSDHWPITSVGFAGGGVAPNRMIGNYTRDGSAMGVPVQLVGESGQTEQRAPRSGDVVHTALRMMGVEQFSIPGGSGEIVGLRAT